MTLRKRAAKKPSVSCLWGSAIKYFSLTSGFAWRNVLYIFSLTLITYMAAIIIALTPLVWRQEWGVRRWSPGCRT